VNWVHAIGLYIVIGVIVFGLGMLAKVHMGGKVERSVPFVVGMLIGVLLWPFVLAVVGIAWKLTSSPALRPGIPTRPRIGVAYE
jgi:cell shape-determining protein MreD